MKSVLRPLFLASILATASVAAFSQAPAAGPGGGMMGPGGRMHEGMDHHAMGKTMNPARMQARIEKRQAVLKAMLKLTPAQEAAWTTFTTTIKPPTNMMVKHPDPVEMAKLTTPERIDKAKALRNQHMAEMNAASDKRGEATKTFYAVLTPEQQKVFDAASARHLGPRGNMGGPRAGMGPGPAAPKQ